MLGYEIAQILHFGAPVLGGIICMLIGIWVSSKGWKDRIYRYSKAAVIKTLEFQENKIKTLEEKLRTAEDKIGTLEGISKRSKAHALKILGINELGKGD